MNEVMLENYERGRGKQNILSEYPNPSRTYYYFSSINETQKIIVVVLNNVVDKKLRDLNQLMAAVRASLFSNDL